MNKKQKKLLIECVEHFMSWEKSNGRAYDEKTTVKVFQFLNRIDKIPTVELIKTKKYSELIELRKLLNS